MPHNVTGSMEWYRRAERLIPGATQLVSRRPTRYAYGVSPAYATHAKGARFWDVDGNEYIDWVSGIGAIILGYADPVVDRAVEQQLRQGTIYSVNHPLEVELAEFLVELIPCAEMVRYAKGGGEACAIAVRIARGATGRDKILFSGYHGWHDWYLAANLDAQASLDLHLFPGIEPIGVPRGLQGTAIPFPYGDLPALEAALREHGDETAAVILEPQRSEPPPAGYLAGVAELTRRAGAVLIFDEVSTGFRPAACGVQGVLDVVPDLAVFAKSISNGYPMGVVAGSRDVMEAAVPMFISSTYWSDTLGLRAALVTLQEIQRRDVPGYLQQLGAELKQAVNQRAAAWGVPVACRGVDYHPHLQFDVPEEQLRSEIATFYIQEMAVRGCHGYPSFYLNAAQAEPEVQQTLAAIDATFELLRAALERGDVASQLRCELRTDAFRRLVN